MTAARTTWMIRSPKGSLADDWEEQSIVAMGFHFPEDLSKFTEWQALVDHLKALPAARESGEKGVWQTARFVTEPREGDRVLTYDPGRREYLYGVLGCYRFDPDAESGLMHLRDMAWKGRIARDNLSPTAKNSLGSLLTIFALKAEVADEIDQLIAHGPSPTLGTQAISNVDPTISEEDVDDEFDGLSERGRELIKDRVARLDASEMEHLVAGVLRAMGYKTRVSPKGSDLGRDVIASPDGLGFETPRIVVEVKHRKGASSAPQIRGLLGALNPGDRGLFVSTGGFTKDSRYEADRANPTITLLDLDELIQLLIDNYENTDSTTKTLVPLKPLYWPAGS